MRELTHEELDLLDFFGTAYVLFQKMEPVHSDDAGDFIRHIHALQNIVLARPATESLNKGKGWVQPNA